MQTMQRNPLACSRCGEKNVSRNGKIKGVQRFLCKSCGYNFIPGQTREPEEDFQVRAIQLYLEGLSLRQVGRFLGVSYGTVRLWVNKILHPAAAGKASKSSLEKMNLSEMQGKLSELENGCIVVVKNQQFYRIRRN